MRAASPPKKPQNPRNPRRVAAPLFRPRDHPRVPMVGRGACGHESDLYTCMNAGLASLASPPPVYSQPRSCPAFGRSMGAAQACVVVESALPHPKWPRPPKSQSSNRGRTRAGQACPNPIITAFSQLTGAHNPRRCRLLLGRAEAFLQMNIGRRPAPAPGARPVCARSRAAVRVAGRARRASLLALSSPPLVCLSRLCLSRLWRCCKAHCYKHLAATRRTQLDEDPLPKGMQVLQARAKAPRLNKPSRTAFHTHPPAWHARCAPSCVFMRMHRARLRPPPETDIHGVLVTPHLAAGPLGPQAVRCRLWHGRKHGFGLMVKRGTADY